MTRSEALVVRIAVLVGGAVLMALEVAGFRIIGRTFGSALRETTTVIAVFLTAMAIGYSAGGRIGDRWPRVETLAMALLAAAATLLSIPSLDGAVTPFVASGSNLSLHAFFATAILFSVPTFILATLSPIAVRLFARDTSHSGTVAGSIAALSTVGSVVGTVVTAFVLIDWIGSINLTVVALGMTCGILALAVMIASKSRVRAAVIAAAVVVLLIGSLAFTRRLRWSGSLSNNTARVLFERDSPYHHVTVLERSDGARDLLIDRTMQSRLYVGDPNERGFEYEEYAHVLRLIRPQTRRALLIGLGGGTLARQFTRFYPDTSVDVVEIDPLIVAAAEEFFDVRPTERLRIHVADGRVFMKRETETFDLISVDAYTRGRYGSTIPPHLVTREFFQEASRRLSHGGFVRFHSYAPRASRFSRSLYRTMTSVFPSVIVLGETEIIASNTPMHVDEKDLKSRAGEIRKRVPFIDARIATLNVPHPDPNGVPLLTDDYAPVDLLLYGH